MKKLFVLCAAVLAAVTLAACQEEAQVMDQELVADIRTPEQGSLALTGRFVAALSPAEEVSIMPLVSGQLSEVRVQVGQRVTAGEVLAKIDDKSARAQLNSAAASYELSQRSAAQSLGASWDMQTLSTNSSISQIQDSINSYYQQIDDAREAIADLEEQIDDLEDAEDDLDDKTDELADGLSAAESAVTAARTKYFAALAVNSQLEAAGLTLEQVNDPQNLLYDADAPLREQMTAQGLLASDLTESGISLLKSAYETADSAYNSLFSLSGGASGGSATIDSAIAQCEAGIKQYETAIEQYETAIRTYQSNLTTAQQSAAIRDTRLKEESQAVLAAQLGVAAAGVSAARQALDYYTLTTPIDGVVTAVNFDT